MEFEKLQAIIADVLNVPKDDIHRRLHLWMI